MNGRVPAWLYVGDGEIKVEAALLIKEDGDLTIRAQRVAHAETREVERYCHSTQREKKEQGMAERFTQRFEHALESVEGLHSGKIPSNAMTRSSNVWDV
jgi:hypothetical protein